MPIGSRHSRDQAPERQDRQGGEHQRRISGAEGGYGRHRRQSAEGHRQTDPIRRPVLADEIDAKKRSKAVPHVG
jgi:hypothetical protein